MLWGGTPAARPVYLKSTFDLWGLAAILSDDRATFPAGPHTFYEQENLMKKTYPSIPGLEPDAWSNDACRGYAIMAMQDCGFSHEDIRRVVRQLYEVFDFHTINEAEQKYYHGGY